jgi:hypothetical protein
LVLLPNFLKQEKIRHLFYALEGEGRSRRKAGLVPISRPEEIIQ